jgi:hypothetical protein
VVPAGRSDLDGGAAGHLPGDVHQVEHRTGALPRGAADDGTGSS